MRRIGDLVNAEEKAPVSASDSFSDLLRRVRSGDEDAAASLVQCYEQALQRFIRFRLADPALRRVIDSLDVCQSVLASFFVRATAGQYDLDSPAQLQALLLKMARNKLAMQFRRHHTQKRHGPQVDATLEELAPATPDASPGRLVAGRELLQEVRRRLSEEERQLADLRAHGEGWAAIALQVGGTPDGCRMKLTRALDRVTSELGLEEDTPSGE
jgi:RNA polymerase sigma-70 factor (ECF subfamily)